MVDATHISFQATDRSYFSLLKKEIHKRAYEAGILPSRIDELDLVVAEMTSNLYKYSDGGEILMGTFANAGSPYIEIISIDNGPGMLNPSKMVLDGISTSNTLGHGFGSIKRLSDVFELYSIHGWGTIVLSRIYNNREHIKKAIQLTVSPLIVAKPGETTSGDGMIFRQNEKQFKLMLADGLGHGPEANKAVNEAADAFKVCPDNSPTEILRFIHECIKKTRGAVINILAYDFETNMWSSAGIGNIAVRLSGQATLRNHMTYNGIVGHNIPNTMSDQQYPLEKYNQVILCSDGIKTRWDLSKYPMISKYDGTILSAALYKDQARRNDDMSVILIKIK